MAGQEARDKEGNPGWMIFHVQELLMSDYFHLLLIILNTLSVIHLAGIQWKFLTPKSLKVKFLVAMTLRSLKSYILLAS